MNKWNYIENICVMASMCFLCWVFHSGWPCLLMLWCNYQTGEKPKQPTVEKFDA